MSGRTHCWWLRCQASKGQFANEVAISGVEATGDEFSLFVDRRFVDCPEPGEGESVDALVRVGEIEREGELVLVSLPGRTLANGQTITVHADKLECRAWQEA